MSKMNKIAVFVTARLKSKRLKNKALAYIGGKSSIEWCLENSSKIKNISKVYLLTSYLKKDNKLAKFKFKKKFKIFRGNPENIIERFLKAAKKYKIETIIRVTGDNPFVSHEIISILLRSHLKSNSDFTTAKKSSIGTSAEIIKVSALKYLESKIKNFSKSEYLTMFFLDNPKYFKINLVNLPKKMIRNYRLTLDYKEDLLMLNELYKIIHQKKLRTNLNNIFSILDKNKYLDKINNTRKQVYNSTTFRKRILKYTKINS
jgi:N,N'-diacetyllegionaminate synthase